MKRVGTKADLPADNTEAADPFKKEGIEASSDAEAMIAQPTSAPYQELLTSWWTTAALAWGTPVRMWSEIVAAAWRPFLPPTALTAENRLHESPPWERAERTEAPVAAPAGAAGSEPNAARGRPVAAGAGHDTTAPLAARRRSQTAGRPPGAAAILSRGRGKHVRGVGQRPLVRRHRRRPRVLKINARASPTTCRQESPRRPLHRRDRPHRRERTGTHRSR